MVRGAGYRQWRERGSFTRGKTDWCAESWGCIARLTRTGIPIIGARDVLSVTCARISDSPHWCNCGLAAMSDGLAIWLEVLDRKTARAQSLIGEAYSGGEAFKSCRFPPTLLRWRHPTTRVGERPEVVVEQEAGPDWMRWATSRTTWTAVVHAVQKHWIMRASIPWVDVAANSGCDPPPGVIELPDIPVPPSLAARVQPRHLDLQFCFVCEDSALVHRLLHARGSYPDRDPLWTHTIACIVDAIRAGARPAEGILATPQVLPHVPVPCLDSDSAALQWSWRGAAIRQWWRERRYIFLRSSLRGRELSLAWTMQGASRNMACGRWTIPLMASCYHTVAVAMQSTALLHFVRAALGSV